MVDREIEKKGTIDFLKFKEVDLIAVGSRLFICAGKDASGRFFFEFPQEYLEGIQLNEFEFSLNRSVLDKKCGSTHLIQNLDKQLFTDEMRKLRINGLGYKCLVDKERNKLVLKLGHSHKVEEDIPSFVKGFVISKTSVKFTSIDKILSGNFLHQLYLKRPADCYKKKGLIKHRMKVRMKPVNKK